ncbi:TPA: PGF-pre-PGF domain-containing protein [Candidatus Woesearchaeota archaeon]|nr:PGF-pre-PGF domain-containing protein [Candidatus Woesearchaeota archaeon]HIH31437.1 PGF-pre-PGF domain-containing protein [Candidatus Woesearchaeota archaeon]HIH54778.1 PGF-pre-PGF domain-containing protein [Candidatus Woesearchaeota archaeon]HIJ01279.1 PGF-pre-PGF domain-containing protein [Candidatus Woesearchaeota archaeon]HIJ13684.1 PGF-pre-PGF domain-containing protein [Candidatus Woesearchaeota archaeon]
MNRGLLIYIAIALLAVFQASAATISASLGSYDTEIYSQDTVNIPVTITATNITGNIDVTLTPKTGLGCDTCTISESFTGSTNEQKTVTFTLTGTQTGNYNPPFVSISAISGSTQATPITSGSQISVVERPTWTLDLSASDSNIETSTQITLTLEITPTGTFQGVAADLTLPNDWTLVSGSDPRSIGTITGASSYQWTVRSGTSTGTKTVSVGVSATSPVKSSADNTESLSITVASNGSNGGSSDNDEIATQISSSAPNNVITTKNYLNAGITNWPITNADVPFTMLDINMKKAVTNKVNLSVTKLLTADPGIPSFNGKTFAYLEVKTEGLLESDINDVKIKFKVPKQWLTDNNIAQNDIRLYRYVNNAWQELPTTAASSTDDMINFIATSPGFSYFVIAELPKPAPEPIKETAPVGPEDDVQIQDSAGQNKKSTVWIIVALVIVLVIITSYIILKKKKSTP